jgi:hypothetical protein
MRSTPGTADDGESVDAERVCDHLYIVGRVSHRSSRHPIREPITGTVETDQPDAQPIE